MAFKCEWKDGDVFAYRMESDLAKERFLFGRYLLIQKIDETTWYPKHIIPIVYVKITKDDKLPTTVEEFNKLEFVQISFSRYEERFWPIDGARPAEDIAEKSKLKYEVDEYGFLPQFRLKIITRAKREIPKKLIYAGNFSDTLKPEKEFVPHCKINISSVFWNEFEKRVIEFYFGHNLRRLSIYNQ